MEWKILWLWWLCWASPLSFFLRTCWRVWLKAVIGSSVVCLHTLPLPLSATWKENNQRTHTAVRWTIRQEQHWQVSRKIFASFKQQKITGARPTSLRVPSHLESAFACLADFPLANTLSTGPAMLCCHKTHILSCRVVLIGPGGCLAFGSSFFKVKDSSWRGQGEVKRTSTSRVNLQKMSFKALLFKWWNKDFPSSWFPSRLNSKHAGCLDS